MHHKKIDILRMSGLEDKPLEMPTQYRTGQLQMRRVSSAGNGRRQSYSTSGAYFFRKKVPNTSPACCKPPNSIDLTIRRESPATHLAKMSCTCLDIQFRITSVSMKMLSDAGAAIAGIRSSGCEQVGPIDNMKATEDRMRDKKDQVKEHGRSIANWMGNA